ncbi:hypothetical protein H9P43_008381 [Blastocladiella emersonii ATCC 22665]|nr:hypothetical protein H9P43_008381 [Blastocladiella emersonii ATCC 22665]
MGRNSKRQKTNNGTPAGTPAKDAASVPAAAAAASPAVKKEATPAKKEATPAKETPKANGQQQQQGKKGKKSQQGAAATPAAAVKTEQPAAAAAEKKPETPSSTPAKKQQATPSVKKEATPAKAATPAPAAVKKEAASDKKETPAPAAKEEAAPAKAATPAPAAAKKEATTAPAKKQTPAPAAKNANGNKQKAAIAASPAPKVAASETKKPEAKKAAATVVEVSPEASEEDEEEDDEEASEFIATISKATEDLMEVENELDALDKKHEQAMLKLFSATEASKAPVYKKRRAALAKIPNFWPTVLCSHEMIEDMIAEEDVELLQHLKDVYVVRPDSKNAAKYRLEFTFDDKNGILAKPKIVVHVEAQGENSSVKVDPIQWAAGKNFTAPAPAKGKKRALTYDGFFSMFTVTEENEEEAFAFFNTIANEIFSDAFTMYMKATMSADGDEDDSDVIEEESDMEVDDE